MIFAATAIAAGAEPPALYHLPGLYEPFAAISHFLGVAIFAVLGTILMRRRRGDPAAGAMFGLYTVANVFQFSMSGLYHTTVRGSSVNQFLGRLDHAAVFLMIACMFTPIYSLCYRGRRRRLLLFTAWGGALCGILFTTVLANNATEGVRLGLYQALGWSSIGVFIDLWRRYGFTFVWPMLAGSTMISFSALAQEFGWPILVPGVVHAHETFHVVLLIGSVQQWMFLWQLADGEFTCGGECKPATTQVALPARPRLAKAA